MKKNKSKPVIWHVVVKEENPDLALCGATNLLESAPDTGFACLECQLLMIEVYERETRKLAAWQTIMASTLNEIHELTDAREGVRLHEIEVEKINCELPNRAKNQPSEPDKKPKKRKKPKK